MSELVKATSDEQFEKDILQSELPVLVDFWAEWCGPCKMLVPVLDELATEYQGRVNFYKANVDDSENVAAQYGVRNIPYLILFKDGNIVATEVGAKTKSQLSAFLDQYI